MRQLTKAQYIELEIKEKKRIISFHQSKIFVAERHIDNNKKKIAKLEKKLQEAKSNE